jgi:enediyne biosynthesis protein E4
MKHTNFVNICMYKENNKQLIFNKLLIVYVLIMLCYSCSNSNTKTLFSKINQEQSGIYFTNTITETSDVNLIVNEYTYMGGGVGIGDFNNDGLQDVYFTGNMVSSKLYINEGSMKFKDVTDKAKVTTNEWCTGVSIVDINNDGWQDIYVCVSGAVTQDKRKNKLFINNKNLTFTEVANVYGLADTTYATQAAFFDYDKDGLLDMFLLTHQMQGESMNNVLPKNLTGQSPRNDKLYHNEGISKATGHPLFKDVTIPSGIRDDGYGLGLAVSDFNNDNWLDIYVSNDYVGNDCLWLNNKNGTFTNTIATSLNHQSYSSMGTDAADINNDGLPDIITLDMMPGDNTRQKKMFSFLTNERHEIERRTGYEPSFIHNTLQLNRGNALVNDTALPVFSDIAHLSGIAETDWSWSVLTADFDNDGKKDLHITNGMGRDMIDNDFIFFRSSTPAGENRQQVLYEKLKTLGAVPLPNYYFTNNGGYTFENASLQSGINETAISNGAAYADFDNDGDLDLVVNNINEAAFLFKNNTNNKAGLSNYLKCTFKGPASNPKGIGAKVKLFLKDSILLLEQLPIRGYLSCVDNNLFFGLGKNTSIDSMHVIWPNDSMQILNKVAANKTITLDYKNATALWKLTQETTTLFTNYTKQLAISYKHTDPYFFDFTYNRLLLQKYSTQGPGIAVADINNDGLEDFFSGNGYENKGQLFIQQANGQFLQKPLETGDKFEEDTDANFFDADKDGDMDLLVTNGTNEFGKGSLYSLPRLYTNDGKGNFVRNTSSIPTHCTAITSVVKTFDVDYDGDEDVFLGGRLHNEHWPMAAPSYILLNNGGVFEDVTERYSNAFKTLGMVTGATWADIDGDAVKDLIVTGEWMPIRIFKNNKTDFTEITNTGIDKLTGMWRNIVANDIDKDGDTDLVVGNIGKNSRFHFSEKYPLALWHADIDANGSIDPIACYYLPNASSNMQLFPAFGLTDVASQIPAIKKKYLLHKDFAAVTMDELFHNVEVNKLEAKEPSTCWFENNGKGNFIKHELPIEAQFAPTNCITIIDCNKDGINDIVLAGNEYGMEVSSGALDASYGLVLIGGKGMKFTAQAPAKSGFFVRGDVRCMKKINIKNSACIITAVNNQALQIFKSN